MGALSLMLTSCVKDILPDGDDWGGTYELILDGEVVKSGSTEQVGLLGNLASVSEGDDFGLLVANVPGTKGGVTQIDDGDDSGVVTITGRNLLKDDGSDELYISMSGSITRATSTKITFEGTITSFEDVDSHTFSGTMESNAFKLIL